MPALRLLTVVSASLLLLANAEDNPVETPVPTTKYKVTLETEQACLSEINDARKDAGLSEFAAAAQEAPESTRLPAADDESAKMDTWVWKPVCEVLIPGEKTSLSAAGVTGKAFPNGTYAFQVVDENTASCTAVVDNWKKAYTNFDELPPPYTEDNELYKKQDNVSLVAIYNPNDKATADCRVVTCTKTVTTSNQAAASAGTGDSQTAKTETTGGSALICLTTPDALSTNTGAGPFTEEQWGKIVSSIKGSASVAFPSLVGVAAAVLGLLALI